MAYKIFLGLSYTINIYIYIYIVVPDGYYSIANT